MLNRQVAVRWPGTLCFLYSWCWLSRNSKRKQVVGFDLQFVSRTLRVLMGSPAPTLGVTILCAWRHRLMFFRVLRRTAKYLKQVFCKRGWLGSNHEERVVNPQKLGYWGFFARKLATQPQAPLQHFAVVLSVLSGCLTAVALRA